ncbi:MAG TPA: rod shape-determining protein RodA [Candidatus Ornithocaccomicrobium faecavium]|uniref:Rod shape-determining protein RodA n=1 Tax=Candidatus Ornithocaccomicrobium faecavium TaxID=2840890 RepID=A0A9D1P5E1_9FIRM|nr:rod shape-determining protein RodA [Clostridiales bacterium]HIV26943.1 rod shape-determining protein RodA [Candidatus Ornithocaccomicrobium faecavium]
MRNLIAKIWDYIRHNKFETRLLGSVDWYLAILVWAISLFGVVCIFAATASANVGMGDTLLETISMHPITYARLQLIWICVGVVAMAVICYFSYTLYGDLANLIYWANVIMLLLVLLMAEVGRGGMTAFFQWGGDRSIQPSEFGKIAIIIALAKLFSSRKKPIQTFGELFPVLIYVGLPLVLIVLQPDVGTALVYIAVFAVLIFVSGTSYKLIGGILLAMVLVLVPLWYFMNASGESFRLTRILIWLDPESDPDAAMQVVNSQIALGSGGLFGKGLVSEGSFASLGYIPDDHTDMIFAIVCEAFGFVGGGSLILAYLLLIFRLVQHAIRVQDAFGSYIIFGVTAMLLFHIVENICMVIGLLPVTGIPLPFVSYGGSSYLTNILGIGLVQNVVMREKRNPVPNAPLRAVRI